MLALEHETAYVCQAIAVNINFIKQLADELPLYAELDWNTRAITFIQRLQTCVAKLDEHCQTLNGEMPDKLTMDVIYIFAYDINSPLAVIRGYCDLIEMSVPTNDAILIMLEAIQAYAADIREIIDELVAAARTT